MRRLLLLVFCAAAMEASGPAQAQTNQPNIVVILVDDATIDGMGFNAALFDQPTDYVTPNIDALAANSVVARQAYVAAPLCSPSRAGLLTGQYQQRFGFSYNLDSMPVAMAEAQGLGAEQVTIAQHLKGLGYTTGMVGKWHVGFNDGLNLPLDKGFDEFYGLWGGHRHYFHESTQEGMMRRGDELVEAEYAAGGTNDPIDPNANDPIKGRYATDAFGDEAVDFINRRAPEENPYFLYFSLTAPHAPYEAKQSDLDQFANIADEQTRLLTAMNYAMDRAVGRVADAIDASGEETVIIFTNDNGGPLDGWNPPLRGHKGLTWEGGIRVPFFINAPGLQPGIYDAPISAYDILPTVYAAAGGDVAQLDTDGVDLMPHFTGENSQNPHDALFWRTHVIWAVRKGEWKLGSPNGAAVVLYNLASDPAETTDVSGQHPDIVEDLNREVTFWEAEMDKHRWGASAGSDFDHFVFKGESNWFNTANAWLHPVTGEPVRLVSADGYPNLILEFRTKDNGSYGGLNSLLRLTRLPMMINELRLTGNFQGQTSFSGGFGGNPLLFINNLDGEGAKIRLDATSTGTNARFRFDINVELQLFDDLEFTGDGTQHFVVGGSIRDYYEPRSVIKSGTSVLTLSGNNTFRGELLVNGGQVKLTGSNAAIQGASRIVIESGASLSMDSGLIEVAEIDRSAGGAFLFTGGELRVTDVVGNLSNQGGNFSPGASTALSTISGDFIQAAGKLTIELGGTAPGTEFDQLSVGGAASLGGTVQFNLVDGFYPADGDSFEFLIAAGGVAGAFADTVFPDLGRGWTWDLVVGPSTAQLVADVVPNPLPGDYNYDGVVNSADYIVWRKAADSTGNAAADGNGDGNVDQIDYDLWRANFGKAVSPPASGSLTGVPEPSTLALALLTLLAVAATARRR